MKLNPITLANLEGGLAEELFQHALAQILADINDPNTPPEAARGIAMTFVFKPSESREHAALMVKCATKLAGIRPAGTIVHLARKDGKLHALGANPSQMDFTEDEEAKPPLAVVPTPVKPGGTERAAT